MASVQASPLDVDAAFAHAELDKQIVLLEDPAGTLTFDDVRRRGDFAPPGPAGANLGFTKSAWWARVDLRNRDSRPVSLLLRQHYPLIDFVDAWLPAADGTWRHVATGDRRPFDSREFAHRDFVFALDLPAGAERSAWLRFSSGGPVDISLSLESPHRLVGAISAEQLAYGMYFGGFLVLLIYNSFIFLVVRDRAFFYYLLYVVSYGLYFAVHNGISFQYLWPNNPDWGNQALLVLLSLTLLFGMEFTRRFLSSDKNFPRVDRVALALAGLSLLGLAASFFVDYATLIRPIALLTVFVVSMILMMGTLGLLKGYRPARYFMIAWVTLLLGVLLYMLKIFGLVPHNAITQNGFQIGSLLEMVLLSLALASRVDELQRESVTDPLTKLSNRRFFDQHLDLEFTRTQRGEGPLGLLMVDIDHFKQFNDRFGHAEGDEVLKIVARALRDSVRRHDLVCRYGGEEFAVLLPGAGAHEAAQLGEVLRKSIEQRHFTRGPITVSIGAASTSDARNRDARTLFGTADEALYRAKAQGRNRVVVDAA
ncbi:MAG TPA: diguanylate cyclase [Xanthomonadales bacterium]|nr:diguanylate cyclase [Xanthomonadales bacterium]